MHQTILAFRKRLATMFEDQEPRSLATRVFDYLLTLLIVTNVAGIVLESVDWIRSDFAPQLDAFEAIATAIFAVEYVLRLWACVDYHTGAYTDPLWGRLCYMRSFFAIVDLVAVLPALLGVLGAADLRVLRLLRLLRLLKLVRHSSTFEVLWSVLRAEARSILALVFVLFLTVTISGSLMYMMEGEVQPTVFTSIPVAMWWAVETLTTVGYGDYVPITVMGRFLGGGIATIGIGTLALFSGLITTGFIEQLKIYREQRGRLHVAVSDGTSVVEVDYRTSGNGGDGAMTVAVPTLTIAAHASRAAFCPHCGGLLPAVSADGDGREQSLGVARR